MQINGGDWGDWQTASIASTTSYKQFYNNSISLSASKTYKIQFRGNNPTGFGKNTSTDYYRIILGSGSTSWQVTMSGNIMSLIVGYDTDDEAAAKTTLAAADEIPSTGCFCNLFNNYVQTGVGNQGEPASSMTPPRINASNLMFPAKYLTNSCYAYMFYSTSTVNNGSTLLSNYSLGLNEGPTFLATEFTTKAGANVSDAFARMFMMCQSLKSVHVNFTTCPGNNCAYWVSMGPSSATLYAPTGFSSCSTANDTGIGSCWTTKTAWSWVAPVEAYTITWKSEDGVTTLETDASQAAGAATAFNGATPTKSGNAQYSYTFDGWATEANGAKVYNNGGTPNVSGDATYYAHFSSAVNKYTITFEDEDGTPLQSSDLDYGATPVYTGATPTKASTETTTYTFAGWNTSIATVTGPATYTATYNSAERTYTVTWKNANGTILEEDAGVAYGATPSYDGATPTQEDEYLSYTFSGWDGDITATVSHDVTFTATYTTTPKAFVLYDDKNKNDPYYTTLANMTGQDVPAVTFSRNFAAKTWNVFSLPFDYMLAGENRTFAGDVYELSSIEYDAATNNLSLFFMPATLQISANRPYLYYSESGVDNPVFANVRMQAIAPNYYNVTDAISGGSIQFRNTTYRQQLEKDNKKIVFITSNRLFYMGSNNIYLRAFRGYFYLTDIDLNVNVAPRARIVLGNQTATEIEVVTDVDENTGNNVRKYVENGVMIIEREGVRYDAQGSKIE